MGYIWLIAFLLLIWFGFEVAAGFIAFVLTAGIVLLLVSSVFMTLCALMEHKLWDAFTWGLAAMFFIWLARICI